MASKIEQNAEGIRTEVTAGQIYPLIGKAIGMIGAIGKERKNSQQGFMYRGIDQVYNALNPVMAELGIFFCPEVLEQKREERTTQKGAVLIYTILTMRFTAYAPDGSSVSMIVVGEGMDSGDKSANKAMSVAMKYAMFQLFCIPTEEMKDPDADVYTDIQPRGQAPAAAPRSTQVSTGSSVPPTRQSAPQAPAKAPTGDTEYLQEQITILTAEYQDDEKHTRFYQMLKILKEEQQLPNIKLSDMNRKDIDRMVQRIHENFPPEAA